jgi:hypothetical protein
MIALASAAKKIVNGPAAAWGMVVLAYLLARPAFGESCIVQDGLPCAEIVVSANPPRMAAYAASEFQTNIFKITGATLPIVTTASPDVVKIYVGRSAYTDALGLDDSNLLYGAFLMKSGTNWLALLGRDADFTPPQPYNSSYSDKLRMMAEWDALTGQTWENPHATLYKNFSGTKLGGLWLYDDRGSLNAVHEYLRGLGVRWFFPGDLGEVVPQMASLALPAVDRTVRPDFAYRHILFYVHQFAHSDATTNEIRWQLRLGLDAGRDVVGLSGLAHGILPVINRDEVRQAHPEYYALWGGLRATNTPDPCLSIEGLYTQNVAYVKAVFSIYSNDSPTVSVMPTDGYTSLCECPLCEGKDTPERGTSGNLSDYVWDYVNRVATNINAAWPDRKITCGAYTTYLLPPTNIDLLCTNIIPVFCKWRTDCRNPSVWADYTNTVTAWLAKVPSGQVIKWDYYLHSGRTTWEGVPVYFPRLIAQDLRFQKGKSLGEFIEVNRNYGLDGDTWHALAADHLNCYVTSRIYWDASQDIDELLDDYYDKFYGPAADEMKAFVEYCEGNWPVMRQDKAVMDQMLALLGAAVQAAGSGIYSQRVDLLVEYVKPLKAMSEALSDRYVAQNGQTPVHPYTNWATAASNIQDAVNAAGTNANLIANATNTVWVGAGRYTVPPNATNYMGNNVVFINRSITLRSSNGVPADTIIDGQGTNRGIAIVSAARWVLDGFTISNCWATNYGGGIYVVPVAGTGAVRNCVITDNTVGWGTAAEGGGMWARLIGAFNYVISNCTFRNNRALSDVPNARYGMAGAALLGTYTAGGGGLVSDCLIENNSAGSIAGGLHLGYETLKHTLERCVLRGNRTEYRVDASSGGGGIYLANTGRILMRNCLMYNNWTAGSANGGAIACQGQGISTSEFYNCTIVSNRAASGGGIFIRSWGSAQGYNPVMVMYNTIVYSNSSDNLSLVAPPNHTNISLNSCSYPVNANFLLPGTGNITNPPGFADSAVGNYRLASGSPCINAGMNQEWMEWAIDLEGHDRIAFGTVDMGAFEYADPLIVAHPESRTNNPGTPASFSITASGSGVIGYQWQKDGGSISEATDTIYVIAAAMEADEGEYRCLVSNEMNTATSRLARLTVNDPAEITAQPQSRTNNAGTSASFTVTVAGTEPLYYQWQKETVNIGSANNATCTISPVAAGHAGNYRCLVSNMLNAVTSAVASLTVNDPAEIMTQPQSQTNNPGTPAGFNVAATGTAPLYYQWQKNGANIGGATETNYTIASALKSDEGNYRCLVSNMVNVVTSSVAFLAVNEPPVITSNPQSRTNNAGTPATFSVSATGTAPLYYQWQKNSTNIGGATEDDYTIASASKNDEGNYRCLVSNILNVVTSAEASLTVNIPPEVDDPAATNVLANTAWLGGNVTATNGFPVTERGICWGTNSGSVIAEGIKYSESSSFGAGEFSFFVTNLLSGRTNYFMAYAVNLAGTNFTGESSFLTRPDAPTILPPTNITANALHANWRSAFGSTNYCLDVASTNNFAEYLSGYSNRAAGLALTCAVTGLETRVVYYYRVRSGNATGVSTDSAVMTVSKGTIGLLPAGMSYGSEYGGANPAVQSFVITNSGYWDFNFTNSAGYSVGATGWWQATPATGNLAGVSCLAITGLVDMTGLNAGTYYATGTVVSAEAGNSPQYLVATLTVNKGNQAIASFTPADGSSFATTNVMHLSAQASSGLPVTDFAVISGPGVISGSSLAFTNSGVVRVKASQGGDTNWNAAANVTNLFNVGMATAVVTLTNLNQTFDGTPRVAGATTVPGGLPVTITYDGSSSAPAAVGYYSVVGVVNSVLYQGSANGILTVNQADQTVTFPAIPDQVTTNTAVLSATASSGLAVGFTVTSGPGSIGGGATLAFTGAGPVSIVASQAGDATWKSAPNVTNTFKVTKANQSITFPAIPDQVATSRVSLAAASDSGLAVRFRVESGPGAVSDDILTFTGAGVVSIVASQSGSALWNAAANVTNNVAVHDVSTLAAPQNLAASDGIYTDKVAVTWNTVSGASGYQVWRAQNNSTYATVNIGNTRMPSYNDNSSAARSATIFYYWVKSYNGVATSEFSNVDSGFCQMRPDPEIISGQPVVGDYDGDNMVDPAVYDLAIGRLYAWLSSSGYSLVTSVITFQVLPGDLPVAGDFEGDGLADPGVFNHATGSWYIWLSSAGYYRAGPLLYGLDAEDIPIPADYDGDGKTDPAVYHASAGTWYAWLSSAGYMKVGPFTFQKSLADIPVPGRFDVDNLADPAMYQQASGAWYLWPSSAGYIPLGPSIFSTTEDHIAVPADYDGDRLCDPAAYVPSLGKWRIWLSGNSYSLTEMELR